MSDCKTQKYIPNSEKWDCVIGEYKILDLNIAGPIHLACNVSYWWITFLMSPKYIHYQMIKVGVNTPYDDKNGFIYLYFPYT